MQIRLFACFRCYINSFRLNVALRLSQNRDAQKIAWASVRFTCGARRWRFSLGCLPSVSLGSKTFLNTACSEGLSNDHRLNDNWKRLLQKVARWRTEIRLIIFLQPSRIGCGIKFQRWRGVSSRSFHLKPLLRCFRSRATATRFAPMPVSP